MDISKPIDLNMHKSTHRRQAAFSLVEVTMAIGIVAFAFLSLLGLVPTGLKTFRQAVDATVGSQITQRVINEAQQTDFDQLIKDASGQAIVSGATGVKALRYFDEQGDEILLSPTDSPSGSSAGLSSSVTIPPEAIYAVNTRILHTTTVPDNANYDDLVTVTVQIANNPGHQPINPDANMLWSDPRFPILTYSGIVARNK